MPYNVYKFHETNIEEILTKHHVNQELFKDELINVNIVQANLKSG